MKNIKTRIFVFTLLFVLGLVSLGFCDVQNQRVYKNISFAKADDHELLLDLYMPIKTSNPNLVVYIHGGGWSGGSKNGCSLKYLTKYGYAVASISYRLTDVAIFPAQIHDCKAAVRWLRAHGDKYGFQTKEIVVSGSSAGGQLAALMGTSAGIEALEGSLGEHLNQSSRVQGVIDFYGATDFVLRSKTQPSRANDVGSVVYLYLGGGADKKVELAKLASAAYHVTQDDPPMLVFHGDQDETVLIDQSEKIVEVYTKAGLPMDYHVLKGAGHGGKRFHGPETRDAILGFLEKVFKSPGK